MAAESITMSMRVMAAKASHSAAASTKGAIDPPPNRATVVAMHTATPRTVAPTRTTSCETALATTKPAREIGLVSTRTAVPGAALRRDRGRAGDDDGDDHELGEVAHELHVRVARRRRRHVDHDAGL